MSARLTPKQVAAINGRLTGTCTHVEVRNWKPGSTAVEVSQFDRSRLIETTKIEQGGGVKVLAT